MKWKQFFLSLLLIILYFLFIVIIIIVGYIYVDCALDLMDNILEVSMTLSRFLTNDVLEKISYKCNGFAYLLLLLIWLLTLHFRW